MTRPRTWGRGSGAWSDRLRRHRGHRPGRSGSATAPLTPRAGGGPLISRHRWQASVVPAGGGVVWQPVMACRQRGANGHPAPRATLDVAGGVALAGVAACLLTGGVRFGSGRQQRLGVGMSRAAVEGVGGAFFHDASVVEHHGAVGEVAHDGQVVGDEDVAEGKFLLQPAQQVEPAPRRRFAVRGRR